jgi:Flp pilus assembly pilin Flp
MNILIEALKKFWCEEDGLEMIEYAVLAALIIVVIAAFIPGVTAAVQGAFANVTAAI